MTEKFVFGNSKDLPEKILLTGKSLNKNGKEVDWKTVLEGDCPEPTLIYVNNPRMRFGISKLSFAKNRTKVEMLVAALDVE
jgi:hypothetical protein